MTYSGKIQHINEKEYNGKILRSFKLANEQPYFGTGTEPIPAIKGDFVTFDGKVDAKGNVSVDLSTFKVTGNSAVDKIAQNAVVRAANKGSASFATKAASKDAYWENREIRDIETQKTIQLQSSRNSAIALASALLQANAVAGYEKAKAQDKMDIICALVQHLTDKFQDESAGNRAEAKQPEPTLEEMEKESGDWD